MLKLQEDDSLLTVHHGNQSVTFILRDEGGSVASLRLLAQKQKRTSLTQNRIAKLTEKADAADKKEDFDQIIADIEALGKEPDNVQLAVDMVHIGAKGWKDFYADSAAQEAGKVMEFNKENIAKLPATILLKATPAIMKHHGLGEEDATTLGEGKGSLPEQSLPMNKDLGSSPNSTSISSPIVP